MISLKTIQHRVAAWRKSKIPDATLEGQYDKMHEELVEVADSMALQMPYKVLQECADVLIVACNIADLSGLDLDQIVSEKLDRNDKRQWKSDGSGKAQHVEAKP